MMKIGAVNTIVQYHQISFSELKLLDYQIDTYLENYHLSSSVNKFLLSQRWQQYSTMP
jgi:hypothetical protein